MGAGWEHGETKVAEATGNDHANSGFFQRKALGRRRSDILTTGC